MERIRPSPAGTPHRVEERERPDLERVRDALHEHDERSEQERAEPAREQGEGDANEDAEDTREDDA